MTASPAWSTRVGQGWYSGHGSNVQTPKLEFGGSPDGLPERDSPCLLVKGADCAGDVQRVAVVIVRSLPVLEGPVPCWCRVVSVGTVCPTYLPRALCSPRSLARVSGGGARGAKSSCRLHVKVPCR